MFLSFFPSPSSPPSFEDAEEKFRAPGEERRVIAGLLRNSFTKAAPASSSNGTTHRRRAHRDADVCVECVCVCVCGCSAGFIEDAPRVNWDFDLRRLTSG